MGPGFAGTTTSQRSVLNTASAESTVISRPHRLVVKSRGGREDVDLAIGEKVARLCAVGRHMRRGGVCLKMVEALPFLDHDKGVRPVFGAGSAFAVGRGALF